MVFNETLQNMHLLELKCKGGVQEYAETRVVNETKHF